MIRVTFSVDFDTDDGATAYGQAYRALYPVDFTGDGVQAFGFESQGLWSDKLGPLDLTNIAATWLHQNTDDLGQPLEEHS